MTTITVHVLWVIELLPDSTHSDDDKSLLLVLNPCAA